MATALVLGASGVSGWAVLNECRLYPTKTTFKRIIGTTNRPLSKATALVPDEDYDRVELYSGFDLDTGVEAVAKKLQAIRNVSDIEMVYFCAYTGHGTDHAELIRSNVALVTNVIGALEKCCPNMKFFTLQTGGKSYGLEFIEHVKLDLPLKESTPRVSSPYGDLIFYYPQVDACIELSKGKKWDFCEIRPDAIVGFVPQNNAMSIVQGLALYFSFYKWLGGSNPKPVIFPGTTAAWEARRTDTSQTILAHFHIHCSFHPEKAGGRSFNIADNSRITQWKTLWPILCKYFGLETEGPSKQGKAQTIEDFMTENKHKWAEWVQATGVRPGTMEGTSWHFINYLTTEWDYDHPFDISAARATGFSEDLDTPTQWLLGFDRMKQGGLIPK